MPDPMDQSPSEVSLLQPTALQQAMILSALSGQAPRANLEQIVLEADDMLHSADDLRQALEQLCQRHLALRLVVDCSDAVPVWRATKDFTIDFKVLDWSCEPSNQLDLWLEHDRSQGFDLQVRCWRAMLAQRGDLPPVLVVTLHHAMTDLPSMANLLEELGDLLSGRSLEALPANALSAYHAAIQPGDAAAPFFAAQFAGFERGDLLVNLTAPSGPMRSSAGQLDSAVTNRLRQRANAAGAGFFAALQAGWALTLARWTGRPEACFGLTLSGRRQVPGHEHTQGALIATLPQRLDISGCSDLDRLLLLTQTATDDLRPHLGVSFAQIRHWADVSPAVSLFDTVLVYSRARLGDDLALRGKGWAHRKVRLLEEGESPVTLAIYGTEALELELEHDSQRLPKESAERLLDHFIRVLTAMSEAPLGADLAGLDMLSVSERAEILALAHPDAVSAEALPCIATRFEQAVGQQPEAMAMLGDGGQFTYAMANMRADILARRLRNKGIGPGDVVAINLPRGADFVIALLSVLKAGAAFLPLDMALPETERSLRAVEADVQAIIGTQGLAGLAVPLLMPSGPDVPGLPDRPTPEAGRLAYVIHTSGSTGRPKGVMGSQGALSAHASAVIGAYGLTAEDRVLHFASPGFDVALEEVVPTLLVGATLVIRSEDETGSVQAFLDFVERHSVTVLNLPASFWHVLVEEMQARGLPLPRCVRLVVTGSERIIASALADWQRIAPHCVWMNGYGPTEATITCTTFTQAPGSVVDPTQDVPIGRPLAHARAYVLAFDGSLAPLGAEGNLHIGGPAVTLGYLNQPEITASVFLPDPFEGEGRLYRTGDRAVWRADGQLLFLGRRDRQVKLRGLRIDLGDVERALGQFEGLRDVRVAVHAAGSDAARLVAWVCGPDLRAGSPALAALVAHVARYMTGATMPMIVPVEAFPLRPNGKVDMAALPQPILPSDVAADGAMDPLTFAVSACMAKVLGVNRLGPEDDIRDFGANSLVALRLASVLEARFGRPIVTTDLYRHPTPRSLAGFLERDDPEAHLIVPIQTLGSKVPFFAVHVLGDKEMLFRPLSAALGPDYPVYGLTVGPPRDLDEISVDRIARRYFDDIQLAFPEGPLAFGAVSMAAYFAYELAQLLLEAGRDVRFVAVLDAQGPDGRPSARGLAKIGAHLGQIARHGWGHIARVRRFRRENREIEAELASARPGEVNGANLVLANVRAVEAYQPRPIACPLVIFRADASFWDSRAAKRSGLGWARVAAGGWSLIDIPGDHLSILEAGNVGVLAGHLAKRL